MALIEDGKLTIQIGIFINLLFVVLKFAVFLTSGVMLFFADTIDSIVDSFVMFLVLFFLRFNFQNKLTFLNMDLMFISQWCVIIIFRVIIILDQIDDLINPSSRSHPELIIISSSIILFGGIILMILFVDEDDVVKCFISNEEKALRKQYRALTTSNKPKKQAFVKILPMFAEVLDNFLTTSIALIVGILLYFNIAVDSLYLIDDISNILISLLMLYLACIGLWELSEKYHNKSYFEVIFAIPSTTTTSTSIPSPLIPGIEKGSIPSEPINDESTLHKPLMTSNVLLDIAHQA